MLEGKSEKLEFQEILSSPHWKKKKWARTKQKCGKKELKEMENKKMMKKKKRWTKGQRKMILHVMIKMILGLITLKHNLGLSILSFETMNLGPHYVPKKSILIEQGYLDWRVSSLRNFCNQQGCGLFSLAKILDKPFTCSGWIFKCIIGQSKKKRKRKKERKKWKTWL